MNLSLLLPYFLVLVIVAVFVFVIHVYTTALLPRLRLTEFYKQYGFVLEQLDSIIDAAVVSIAFAPKDLERYQQEADEKGYDIRLVAAIHIVKQFAEDHGIELDEDLIVAKIEQSLASEKKYGVLKEAEVPDVIVNPVTQTLSPTPLEAPAVDPQQQIDLQV